MSNYNSGHLVWVQSNGGPLLLLERQKLPLWDGVRSWNMTSPLGERYSYGDYDRACEVNDYLGLIAVGDSHGLVLGYMPYTTTWWPLSQGSDLKGILVRWECADDETAVLAALARVAAVEWKPTSLIIEVESEPLCLFDSAYAGEEVQEEDSLLITLEPGSYSIATCHYRPDDSTELLLHGFRNI